MIAFEKLSHSIFSILPRSLRESLEQQFVEDKFQVQYKISIQSIRDGAKEEKKEGKRQKKMNESEREK